MDAFGVTVIVVAIVAAIAAIASYAGSGNVYKSIGKGQFALDSDDRPRAPRPGSPAATAELREEVRQFVIARNERRLRRGEEPLDVEAEVDRQLRELGA